MGTIDYSFCPFYDVNPYTVDFTPSLLPSHIALVKPSDNLIPSILINSTLNSHVGTSDVPDLILSHIVMLEPR